MSKQKCIGISGHTDNCQNEVMDAERVYCSDCWNLGEYLARDAELDALLNGLHYENEESEEELDDHWQPHFADDDRNADSYDDIPF